MRIDVAGPVAWLRRLPAPTVDAGLAVVFLGAMGVDRALNPLDDGAAMLVSAILPYLYFKRKGWL